jgi:hypothetical protein
MERLPVVFLLVAGAVHLLPLPGAFGAEMLDRLYAVGQVGADLEILMRHRAVMFGLLAMLLLGAAVRPAWRGLAYAAGIASAGSFVVIAWLVGGYGAAVGRVVVADVVVVLCLACAIALDRRRLFSR